MLLTNLILLLALVVMVGIAIWLFRDGEGVGPTPYIRPLDEDGGKPDDEPSMPGSSSNPSPTTVRVVSDADQSESGDGQRGA
jgi:hypothetical protein